MYMTHVPRTVLYANSFKCLSTYVLIITSISPCRVTVSQADPLIIFAGFVTKVQIAASYQMFESSK